MPRSGPSPFRRNQFCCQPPEVGDRAGEGKAYANLGNAYQSQGDFSKAIAYQTQHLKTNATAPMTNATVTQKT